MSSQRTFDILLKSATAATTTPSTSASTTATTSNASGKSTETKEIHVQDKKGAPSVAALASTVPAAGNSNSNTSSKSNAKGRTGAISMSSEKDDDDDEDDDTDNSSDEASSMAHHPSGSSAMGGAPSGSNIDLGSTNLLLNIKPSSNFPAPIDDASAEMLMYMLRFSFTKALSNNEVWVRLILGSFGFMLNYMSTQPADKMTMKTILKYISTVIGIKLSTLNRKKEELLSFEAAIIMAYMKSKYCENVNLVMEDFLSKYTQFNVPEVSEEEKARLLEFCNCVRVVQRLIAPNNNKEHILDLVTRMTEGFSVRRITGTGMTVETRHRYEIIHIEGNITPKQRPERRVEKVEKPQLPAAMQKKRGRPLSVRSDDSEQDAKRIGVDKISMLLQAGYNGVNFESIH